MASHQRLYFGGRCCLFLDGMLLCFGNFFGSGFFDDVALFGVRLGSGLLYSLALLFGCRGGRFLAVRGSCSVEGGCGWFGGGGHGRFGCL